MANDKSPQKIVRTLTKAQQADLLDAPDGKFQGWLIPWERRVPMEEIGLIESFDDSRPGAWMKLYRVTPLGIAVRALLQEQPHD